MFKVHCDNSINIELNKTIPVNQVDVCTPEPKARVYQRHKFAINFTPV